ncbi:ABC transporter permease [Desulfovibrio mangrovi]|uniref:ABC transporter permease n=1 Tax=Desulfovibrio mangrovi TaxID=2976983 RepID=UPI002247CDE1|nr:ABC transporter permease [Desulfovibrio mangrovi]UZP66906.1 ABC transporter permease [Desulfovibrio mangrovi]
MLLLEKRHTRLKHQGLITAAIALGTALAAGAIVMAGYGANPFAAYAAMFKGALGSGFGLAEVVVKAIPLMLTGLAVALCATMLLWNIGCEGQFVMGGIGAAGAVMYLGPVLPQPLLLPAVILCGALCGALWALIPAYLRVWGNVSEILTTLLLNYVAIIAMEHLYFGPWRDPDGMGFPGTPLFPPTAMLPRFGDTRIHLGLIIALLLVVAFHYLLARSKWGFSVRIIGNGPKAAAYAGLNVSRQTLLVMAMSGALAGLAGMGEAAAIHYRLQEGFASGYGYDGIIVACLAALQPRLVPFCALLLGIFIVGGEQLATAMQLPSSISRILEGALLFGFLLSETICRYHIKWASKKTA